MNDTATRKPVLRAEGLSRHYPVSQGVLAPKATLKALDGVSFDLHAGETVAVVGESGCGKSTLARLLTLIEPPTAGTLELAGLRAAGPDAVPARRLRREVQMVFQDPYGSLNPRKNVGAIISEPLRIQTRMTARERETATRAMMERVGLRPEHYPRYPHMFSGGQRQRIALARALMLRPKVVVADEPVSALDVSIQAQVLNLMMDLQDELNLAYVFISHDLSVVRHIANEVVVMYLGKPMEQGPKELIFDDPRHPYTRVLLAATPTVDPALKAKAAEMVKGELPSPLNPPPGCPFNARCPYATQQCVDAFPPLRSVRGRLVSCHYAEEI